MLKTWKKKGIALLIVVCVLFVGAVGSTLAYLIARTETVTDEFEPAHVKCAVLENDNGTYSVKNESNIPVYIRVAIVATATDIGGNLIPGSVTINPVLDRGWFNFGDYYYYNDAIDAGDEVQFGLLNVSSVTSYVIHVLAEAIQAKPNDAIETAWGILVPIAKIEEDTYEGF